MDAFCGLDGDWFFFVSLWAHSLSLSFSLEVGENWEGKRTVNLVYGAENLVDFANGCLGFVSGCN